MTYIKKIKLNQKEIQININSDADESVFNEVFLLKDYKIVDHAIKSAGNIIDIGGHVGMFSIYAKIVNPNARIVAFEPNAENFKELKANLKKNHINDVKCKNVAVSGKIGAAILNVSEDSHNHSIVFEKDSKSTSSVNTTTLEKIATPILNHNPHIDLVKMDCEGSEFDIFENTPVDILKKIKTFYIEYHLYKSCFNLDNIISKLKMAGFSVKKTVSPYDKRMGFVFAERGGKI